MHKLIRTTALAVALLAAFPAAQAAVQNYSFSGQIEAGPTFAYSGTTFQGTFSFDDAGLLGAGNEYIGLTSFNWNFQGTTYTLFNADAAPEANYLDGQFLGLTYSASPVAGPQVSLIGGSVDTSDAFLTTYTPAGSFGGNASLIYAAVPEPESYAMLLAGLGLMGLVARRRAKAA